MANTTNRNAPQANADSIEQQSSDLGWLHQQMGLSEQASRAVAAQRGLSPYWAVRGWQAAAASVASTKAA